MLNCSIDIQRVSGSKRLQNANLPPQLERFSEIAIREEIW